MKFRASQVGRLMVNGRSKADIFGQTALTYIQEVQIGYKYNRWPVFASKYTSKGNEQESAAVAMVNRVLGTNYILSPVNFREGNLTGTPDIIEGSLVVDIKNSWDIWTFSKAEVTDLYYWQLQAYMHLTGATSAKLIFCLMNASEAQISDEKRRVYYGLGGDNMPDESVAEYQAKAEQITINMTFDDIPETERVKVFNVERDDAEISRMLERVELAVGMG